RILFPHPLVGLQHRPGTGIGLVDQRDFVVQERRHGLVEIDALLDDGVAVGVRGHAGRVERGGSFGVAGLVVVHVITSGAVRVWAVITSRPSLLARPTADAAPPPRVWSDRTPVGL